MTTSFINNTTSKIQFNNVHKDFFLQTDRTVKDLIPSLLNGNKWASRHMVLNDISFNIKSGECVGIVGKNGAGKSTIMKLIAGVTYPNKGKIIVEGRVAPLIELGAGFHHELTGIENIYLSGAIFGMNKQEVESQFEKIVDFSGIDKDFLNIPIKRYSSGMLMRLAFSTAVHVNASIFLIDEVLAVGDASFQKKCLRKLSDIKEQKDKIIIFVSHDQNSLENFCERALYLSNGKIVVDDTPKAVFKQYNASV